MKTFVLIFIILAVQNADAVTLRKKDVVDMLKTSSHRWQQTEGQRQDAEAKLQQADSALSPFVSLSARQMIAKINPVQYGVTSQSELSWIGVGSVGLQGGIAVWDSASKSRIEAAKANVRLQSANEKHFKNELTFLALLQLLQVQKAKRHKEVIAASLERDQKILQAAKHKYATGFGIGLDVERAEGLVEHQKFKLIDAETNYLKACQDLASTLALKDLECDVEPLSVSVINEASFEKAGRTRIAEKLDLKASEMTVEAARALRDEAKNESMPKVIAFGETSFVGSSIPNGLEHPLTGMAGIQVSMPIFSGGLHKGRAEEQAVKVNLATLQREQMSVEAQNQLKVALAQLKSAKAALGVSQRQIEIATKELGFAEKKRDTGSIGSLELHTALVNLSNANELGVQVQFAYEAAKIGFCRAVGSTELCLEEEMENKK